MIILVGGVMVTGRGTEICVFVGSDFAGNVSEYDNVLIVLWKCSMNVCGGGLRNKWDK